MENIIEFFVQNYIWFILVISIVLLAIVGYYADKTNFGQGYNKDDKDEEENLIDLSQVKLSTLLGIDDKIEANKENLIAKGPYSKVNTAESFEVSNKNVSENRIKELENNTIINQELKEVTPNQLNNNYSNEEDIDNNLEQPQNKTDDEFEKFDKEFDSIIPKKSIIDDPILYEIENLSFDKTQKLDLSEIPDIYDVELPKIKSMEKIDEDIWKF